ncbi:tetratricopeptide repeat protein [Fulvivirga imtechensis]|uniref:ATP-binding protein n=1 Tax=Fulvivirga imtechensis TaxID=881893 RepID=UPI0016161155|nr:tetratricopeptide repeat protein [Fulvivirga imtechensis]
MQRFIELRLSNLDSALYFAEITHDIAEGEGDSLLMVRAQNAIGWVYQQKGFNQIAIEYYKKGLAISRRNKYQDRERHILNNLGVAYNNNGQYDSALKVHFESLALREKYNDEREIAISANNIGLVYYRIKDYRKAIDFFRRSIKIKQSIGYNDGVEVTLVNLGLCYIGVGDYSQALKNFDRIIEICKTGCAKEIEINSYNGAGIAYFQMGAIEKAKESFAISNKLARQMDYKGVEVINLYYLAQIEFTKGFSEKAINYLSKSMGIAEVINYREWIRNNFELFGQIYAESKDFESAYVYQKKYDSLNRQILNEEVIRNLANVQIAYQEKENLETINLQRTELTRRTTLLVLSVIIIFLALAILILLFRNNQHRKKVNRKLSDANETIEKQNAELTNMNLVLEERVKERTQELNASNAALLKSNTELDNFIYKTSHDIRGPLATLQGMCNVALMDIEDQKSIEYFNKLGKTAQRLNEILSKLLVINQINNSLISDEPIDFESILRVAVNDQKNTENGKKICVKEEIETSLNFRSDEDLVKIIVTNLVTNAFKFHNTSERVESFVHISVARCGQEQICLQVIDNGIGIDEKVSSKIFEIFSKASDMSDTAGLGLYLVKLAVEKLEGQIKLTKTEEGHTCFSVILPYYH